MQERTMASLRDDDDSMLGNVMTPESSISDPCIDLYISIIDQAVQDSMPDKPIFSPKSMDPLFSTITYDILDATDFLSTQRLNPVAIMAMSRPNVIRKCWQEHYSVWKETRGAEIAENIVNHAVKLALNAKDKSQVQLDAISFIKSPFLHFWAGLLNEDVTALRERLMIASGLKQPEYQTVFREQLSLAM